MLKTTNWKNYIEGRPKHTVVGNLKVLEGLYSPQLANRRDLFVYLPPSYEAEGRRYPVIYMHDGQNLFDDGLSYAGEWRVDETIEALSLEGIEAIVVGLPNTGVHRIDEYTPFHDQRLQKGGQGDRYVAFIVDTVKPLIDRDFRTLRDRAHTGTIGSSMGGLISLYAFFRRAEVFGFAGVMSPSLWFAQGAIVPYVQRMPFAPGRLYLDAGTHEGSDTRRSRGSPHKYVSRYLSAIQRMRDLLHQKGYRVGHELCYVEEENALHNEAAWARRLPNALRFLLADFRRPVQPRQIDTLDESKVPAKEPWWEF
jgi:predicted alpha/beta superfamily hydrolase